MGIWLMLIAFASAAIGGFTGGVYAGAEEKRRSYCLLIGLLTSLVVFFLVTVSGAYAPHIVLGY